MDRHTRAYLREVDLVRALAILGVLTVHASALTTVTLPVTSALYPLYNFLNIAFKYGTPTFIFLSAFVLFHTYGDRPVDRALLRRFYGRRLAFVIVPYVGVSALFILIKQFVWHGFPGWQEWLRDFAYRLATGTAHAHLYFIVISIQFYLVFPLLLLIFQRHRRLAVHTFWLGFVLQWLFVWLNGAFWHLPNKGSWAFSYLSVYLLGAGFGMHYREIRRCWLDPGAKHAAFTALLLMFWAAATACHVALMHGNRVHGLLFPGYVYELAWNAHTASAAAVLFYAAHRLPHRLPAGVCRFFENLGRCSFIIYLIHPLPLIAYEALLDISHPVLYHLFVGAKWAAVLAVSWLMARIVRAVNRRWMIKAPFIKARM